jgi:hypothetical protein
VCARAYVILTLPAANVILLSFDFCEMGETAETDADGTAKPKEGAKVTDDCALSHRLSLCLACLPLLSPTTLRILRDIQC